MNNTIDIQIATASIFPISQEDINQWAEAVLTHMQTKAELTIRIVSEQEIRMLNHQYRNIDKSTNVLAFPADIPQVVELDIPLLGDVIVCPSVLANESLASHIPLQHHWAHIVMHGILHLLGYDHIEDADAHIMQALEIDLLKHFDIPNPYTQDRSAV